MAKEELFKIPILGPFFRSIYAFPVKRGGNDTESIRKAISLLESGNSLLLFPEGTRGDGITLGPLNSGVAMMAKKTGAKVVAAGISGTEKVLPRGTSKFKRGPIKIVYGEPFTYDQIAGDASNSEGRAKFNDYLMGQLISLSKEVGLELQPPPH
jgi:1-acyl-sn-glycerol-3-phosphate acyltransferase